MPIFNDNCYPSNATLVEDYHEKLLAALATCETPDERLALLHVEVIEITYHVTNGIRDLIQENRHVRHLVLSEGAVPLATWAESLDAFANLSIPCIKQRIGEMERGLEQGQVQGFVGSMFLAGKPTFTTLSDFYNIIFTLAEQDIQQTKWG